MASRDVVHYETPGTIAFKWFSVIFVILYLDGEAQGAVIEQQNPAVEEAAIADQLGEILEIIPDIGLADLHLVKAHEDHPEERIDGDEREQDDGGRHEPEIIALGGMGIERLRLRGDARNGAGLDIVEDLPDPEEAFAR